MRFSAFVLSSVSALALLGSAQAFAQSQGGIEEIVVTGLRRDTKLLDAPVAVSVYTEANLVQANVHKPSDLLALTPNVTLIESNHAGEAFVNIRGQTSVRNSESAVAVLIDGVQLSNLNEFNGELFDVQQIEVLKGPQGALYGRNAAAGAIIITTKPPSDKFTGQAAVSYGNWNSSNVQVSAGGAIVPEKLRVRAAIDYKNTDGPFTNITTGEKSLRLQQTLGRLRFDYDVNDNLKLDARVEGSKLSGGAIQFHAQIAGLPIGGVPVPRIDTQQTNLPYVTNIPGQDRQDKGSTSLKIDWTTGAGTLTSVTSYNYILDDYGADNFPYLPDSGQPGALTQHYFITNKAFTEEVRFSSPSEQRLRWMAGFYYLHAAKYFIQKQGQDLVGAILPNKFPDLPGTLNPTTQYFNNRFGTRDVAPFGNVQFDITKEFELGLAVRYDSERRSVLDRAPAGLNPVTGTPYSAFSGRSAEQTFDQVTPKITLTYKIEDLGSIYATWGKGFKSGGFNPFGTRQTLIAAAIAAGGNPNLVFVQDQFGKETNNTYEIGFKSMFAGGRARLNGAAFWTDVTGAQEFEFFPTAGLQAISQIDKVRIKGFEFDGQYEVTDAITLFAGFGWLDSRIKALAAQPSFVGHRSPYSYRDNVNAGIQVKQPINDSLDFVGRLDYTRFGSIWYDVSNLPGSQRTPVDLVNARIGIASDRWEFGIWSKNLNNKHYNAETVPLLSIIQAVFPAPPRSFGVDAHVKF